MKTAYKSYNGRSAGRILHFLHHYLPYHIAVNAVISKNDRINYNGDLIALVQWNDQDIPWFIFPATKYFDSASAINNQVNKRQEAIQDLV